jgi:ABC transport system ATP-binding/permease protein
MPVGMKSIRYGQWKRWTDAYHGWRDGREGIPARPPIPGPVTTPHREALIRQAQDSFAYEHLEYRKQVAEPHRRIMAERARLETAQSALTWAKSAFDMESGALTEPETRRRRLGEEHHPETVIVQRRRKEHRKLLAGVQAGVTRGQADLMAIEADLARALQEAEQHHQAAVTRVERIHEHIHRRLAVYRRALVRSHPNGAWANAVLSVRAPDIPGWALPDAYVPEGVPQPSVVPDQDPQAAEEPDELSVQNPVREKPLYDRMVFGSAEANASDREYWLVLDAATRHFSLTRENDGFRLRDYRHGHGPFINGQQATNESLRPGDYFDFGASRYRISADGSSLAEFPLFPATLVVSKLSARTGDKVRLTEMSFVQRKNDLLAILGPSGAGKTSLFSALVGELKPDKGGELYFGPLPLRTHGAQIRELLGFVPQDEHLFKTFTVRRLLRYAFRLRSASNNSRREERITEVCKRLEISGQLDQLVGTLSGGQRKRVSIAVELLSEPKLLLLDEPTSGLDAGMDREVLQFLRDYAGDGNTVIVITHSTEHLRLAQQVLVVAAGGRPVYFGSPRRVKKALGVDGGIDGYAELMKKLINDPEPAADAYQRGPVIAEAAAEAERLARKPVGSGSSSTRHRKVTVGIRQLGVLVQRQTALLLTRGSINRSDKGHPVRRVRGILTVLGPLLIAGAGATLAGLVSGADGLGPGRGIHGSLSGSAALSLLITLSMLTGQALTYSDIVNDYPTIRREHRTGTLTLPVMAAKWLVFAVVAMLQALLITWIYIQLRPPPAYAVTLSPVLELFVDLTAMTIAAMTLGLLISAALPKLEQAIAVATGVSIAQIALNGVASNLSGDLGMNIVSTALPSRWGLAAAAASVNLRHISPSANPDALWHHTMSQWALDLAALGVLTGAYFLLARWLLARRLKAPD